MSHPHRTLGPLMLVVGLLLVACSHDDGGSAEPRAKTTTTVASSKDATEITERKVLGAATVEVGKKAWSFDVTSCVVGKDRITAQGDDQDGATVVASFALESKAGSLTVSSADDAWAVGPAGGTEIEGVKVSKDGISGHGPFTKRTFSEDKEGKRSGDPTDGTFELSCRASEDAGD